MLIICLINRFDETLEILFKIFIGKYLKILKMYSYKCRWNGIIHTFINFPTLLYFLLKKAELLIFNILDKLINILIQYMRR